ncbi:glycoprotein [Bemisia tabaci arlivirus 1]|uniref:Glycoprotein n=1 Tax=Bemisia tabaci arlivirus 1 TaxID=2840017 RepID=A0A8E8FU51_9MONO|nr:glycoprotein [Bemisia tabaci arlivirus 1]QWC36458.1 glycoprotein [Bemisia tabaci arlivirus 1]
MALSAKIIALSWLAAICTLVENGIGSPLQTQSVFLKEPGILIEPKSLVLHHDSVVHTTVMIRLDSVLPESRAELFSNCKQHITREELKKDFKERTAKILQMLPSMSYNQEDSICSLPGTDCVESVNSSDRKLRRPKRFVNIPVAATIFGVVSLGMGLYTYLSQKSIREHVENVEAHISNDEKVIISNSEYSSISSSMFAKNYARSKIFETSLQNTLCSVEKGHTEDYLNLAITEYVDFLTYNVQQAVNGHVTDFLVTRDLINGTLLNRTEFADSVYKSDIGLFYSASTSFLTHVNRKTKALYFLIVTPKSYTKDLTTIYSVSNFGWREDEYHVKYEIPTSFYQVTWENSTYSVETQKEDCLSRSGLLICHSRASTSSPKSKCLHQLLNKSSPVDCRIQREYAPHESCSVKYTLSGLFARNCNSITLVKEVRGILMEEHIPKAGIKSRFFPYTSFETAVIDERSYSSRDTIYQTEIRKVTPTSEVIIPELPSLYSQSELSDLMAFVQKKKKEESERMIHEKVSHMLVSHVVWLVVLMFIIGCCMVFIYMKVSTLTKANSVYTHMMREVATPESTQIRMRSRRGRNTDS